MKSNPSLPVKNHVAFLLFFIGSLFVSTYFYRTAFATHYQVDFSAYYSAAKVIAEGKNPYSDSYRLDHATVLEHSEYLQPPIVAALLWPIGAFSYGDAKMVWYYFEVVLLILVACLSLGSLERGAGYSLGLLVVMPLLFWPLYAHLERGQTDLLVLFFVMLSYRSWMNGKSGLAGMVLAIAAVIKLPAILLSIVPVVVRDKRYVLGLLVGLGLLLSVSVLLTGIDLNQEYFAEYLPAIARTDMLPVTVYDKDTQETGLKSGRIAWDEKEYTVARTFQSPNGSLVRFLRELFGRDIGGLSTVLGLAVTLALMCLYVRTNCRERERERERGKTRKRLWLVAMLYVLVFHPMTWVMNYVWCVAIFPLAIESSVHISSKRALVLWFLVACSVVLIVVADPVASFIYQKAYMVVTRLGVGHWLLDCSQWLMINRVWLGGSVLWLLVSGSLVATGLSRRKDNLA